MKTDSALGSAAQFLLTEALRMVEIVDTVHSVALTLLAHRDDIVNARLHRRALVAEALANTGKAIARLVTDLGAPHAADRRRADLAVHLRILPQRLGDEIGKDLAHDLTVRLELLNHVGALLEQLRRAPDPRVAIGRLHDVAGVFIGLAAEVGRQPGSHGVVS
jgi:hypothetical protein